LNNGQITKQAISRSGTIISETASNQELEAKDEFNTMSIIMQSNLRSGVRCLPKKERLIAGHKHAGAT